LSHSLGSDAYTFSTILLDEANGSDYYQAYGYRYNAGYMDSEYTHLEGVCYAK